MTGLALVEIEVVMPVQGYVINGARRQCAKSRQGGFSSHFAPALSNVQPLIEWMDRTRDSRRSADVPASRDPLFRVFLSAWWKRKLPAAPGRSFGCGGAIKNSPVSGAWIADGTNGHVALVGSAIASRPYRATSVSLFIPSPRSHSQFIVTIHPIGTCISKLSIAELFCMLPLHAIYNAIFYLRENRSACVCLTLYLFRTRSRLISLYL